MKRTTIISLVQFAIAAVVVLVGWWYIEKTFFPPKPPEPAKPQREGFLALLGGATSTDEALASYKSRYKPPAAPQPEQPVVPVVPEVPEVTEPYRLVSLGGPGYNKEVLLSTQGAGVQQVKLPAFDHANRLGREERNASGEPHSLELIPGYIRVRNPDTITDDGEFHELTATPPGQEQERLSYLAEPSYTLLHYPVPGDPRRLSEDDGKVADRYPSPELAKRTWKVVRETAGTDETPAEVVFETTLGAPYHITLRKIFTLAKTDYHLSMRLEFAGTATRPAVSKGRAELRYQIAGPRGLPLEGEWYTGIYRNALMGWKTPNGTGKRQIYDAAHIATEHGSEKVEPEGNTFTYAAVATQFFASALIPDPDVPEDQRKGYWAYIRATREYSPGVQEGKPQLTDISIRAVANAIDPGPGETITHRYWIYNGPNKVRLLKSLQLLEPAKRGYQTNEATVDRYLNDVALGTLTDAPTPNWFGRLANAIFWTDLVIWFTNLMHGILGFMHQWVPYWGVNILMLTVLVRLVLLLPSRRQQAQMMKLQEKMAALKPEIDKLAEKYKGDPQRINQEKTRLMIQHGVNPLSSMGGCLLMFAQMPIFMGLYYCLQESIFFRLDRFLWIQNLAAPDMLLWWTESIPWLSTLRDMGGMIYLGPFLNVLPVIAVALMFINFKISSPPPTDEQQEMQQKMMKYMMIFMGVFFYKMAAGMCVYFITSTTWGLIERKLLKKKAANTAANPTSTTLPTPGAKPATTASTPATAEPQGFMGRFKAKLLEKMEEVQKQAEAQRQIVNKPQQQQQQQRRGGPPPQGNQGNQGKKKRKK